MLKKLFKFNAWTLGARLTVIIFLITSAILLSFIAMINYSIGQQTYSQAAFDMVDKTKIIADILEVFDQNLRNKMSDSAKIFKNNFKNGITLDSSRSINVASVAAPVLVANGGDLNGNQTYSDQMMNDFGNFATIFVKKDNDFIRIATSLKKENGERAMGTLLEHEHPAYQSLLSGKGFAGVSMVLGGQYVTQYDPVFDPAGKVIGALSVGMNFNDAVEPLKKKIRAMTIGTSGYFFALDARQDQHLGNSLIHPSLEGKNLLATKDKDGREIIKEMLQRGQGVLRYPWVNTARGENTGREKIAAFFPMKNWQWVIAGGVYSDEYTVESNKLALRYQIFGVVVLLFIGVILYYTMRQQLSQPLQAVIGAANQLASGDLSAEIKVTHAGEIGQLMVAMNGIGSGLASVVAQVRESTALIAESSQQISHGNADLSARTESQASSLEETVASMNELSGTVKENSESAKHANELVASAAQVATKGGEVVKQVIDTMTSIKNSSRQIVDIISVIDGIAFQTNILALNAAVEAARAGEQGRGFAVVASEVRNLAQRSASAAKEITSLIHNSVNQVEAGNLLAEQTGKTMSDIVASVHRVTDIMSKISAASQEQSSGIEQIHQAVAQMDEITQQNAALVEEAAASSETMHQQAVALVQTVSVFKLTPMMQ
jgi:methyl-accepting chemotaxis protein-2 (aspartate sensor receptor)